jgi:2-polyprenyl-3-methyl-5-hydroxy-6-metoxy-1,4-benzoquinol methylase
MKNCPYCNSSASNYFDFFSRSYNQCLTCGLIYKESQASYEKTLTHYRENYFGKYYSVEVEGGRNKLFNHILDLIEENRGISSLLDVGTSCGFFLVAAQKRGWEAKGIEPSSQSVEVAQTRFDLDVYNGSLQTYNGNGQFDIITFINVLEHSAEPWKEIRKASRLLKPGGLIYLRFPNGFLHTRVYLLASRFGLDNLIHRFLVFHPYCFTPAYITKLLSDYGFTQIAILNSPISEGDPQKLFYGPTLSKFIKKYLYLTAKFIEFIYSGKILLSTSLEAVAVKNGS